MADRPQHQILGFEGLALHGHVLVQGEHAGRLTFETGDHHPAHVHRAVRIAHPQLDRAVCLAVLARDRACRGVHLVRFASWHLGCLEAVDRLDLGVRVNDPPGRVLEHHADWRVAQDRVHHPALAVESVHQLELAQQHRRLAGQHRGEPSRLGAA